MNYLRSFDRAVITSIDKFPKRVQPIMVSASFIASPVPVVILFALVMLSTYVQGDNRLLMSEGVILILIPLGGTIKLLTRRLRRDTMYVEGLKYKTFSFPSGHAYGSLLAFGALAFLCLNTLTVPLSLVLFTFLVIVILLVGVSRVYLGAHYPSDVLGGWLLGAFVLRQALLFLVKL